MARKRTTRGAHAAPELAFYWPVLSLTHWRAGAKILSTFHRSAAFVAMSRKIWSCPGFPSWDAVLAPHTPTTALRSAAAPPWHLHCLRGLSCQKNLKTAIAWTWLIHGLVDHLLITWQTACFNWIEPVSQRCLRRSAGKGRKRRAVDASADTRNMTKTSENVLVLLKCLASEVGSLGQGWLYRSRPRKRSEDACPFPY